MKQITKNEIYKHYIALDWSKINFPPLLIFQKVCRTIFKKEVDLIKLFGDQQQRPFHERTTFIHPCSVQEIQILQSL